VEASTAIPIPTPTSMFFAAAGASDFPLPKFLIVVALCRAARYSAIAFVAEHYGRRFIRVLRHPLEHWGWLTLATHLDPTSAHEYQIMAAFFKPPAGKGEYLELITMLYQVFQLAQQGGVLALEPHFEKPKESSILS